VFEIDVDGMAEPLRYALNTVASEAFEVGDVVTVEYQTVGVPPYWTRSYVREMDAAR
jgi:hypothetical protein